VTFSQSKNYATRVEVFIIFIYGCMLFFLDTAISIY